MLRELGAQHGIAAEAVGAGARATASAISSGRIREALAAGDPGTATQLLTRPFAVEGVVERGDQRGRELGYPTANLGSATISGRTTGSTRCACRLDDGSECPGVASLGVRPTFEPPVELLEAHLFDFDGDLYGRTIEVALHALHPDRDEVRQHRGARGADAREEAAARKLLALE